MSSASCAPPSWSRTLTWRPWRRSWRTPSGSTTRRARASSQPRPWGALLVRQTFLACSFHFSIPTRWTARPPDWWGAGRNHWGIGRGNDIGVYENSYIFENIFCKTSLSFCRMAPAPWISTSSVKWWWPSPSLGMIKKTPKDVCTFFHLWIKVKVVVCPFLCGCGQYTAIYILPPPDLSIPSWDNWPPQAFTTSWQLYFLSLGILLISSPSTYIHLCPSLFLQPVYSTVSSSSSNMAAQRPWYMRQP